MLLLVGDEGLGDYAVDGGGPAEGNEGAGYFALGEWVSMWYVGCREFGTVVHTMSPTVPPP